MLGGLMSYLEFFFAFLSALFSFSVFAGAVLTDFCTSFPFAIVSPFFEL